MPYTPEQERFIVEAYFRSGTRNPDNEWQYSYISCQLQFQKAYPDKDFYANSFRRHVYTLVKRFHKTGSVCGGKATGRPPVCNTKLMDKLKRIRELDPDISLEKLAHYAGISYSSCRKLMLSQHQTKIEEVQVKTEIKTENDSY